MSRPFYWFGHAIHPWVFLYCKPKQWMVVVAADALSAVISAKAVGVAVSESAPFPKSKQPAVTIGRHTREQRAYYWPELVFGANF
mmetsp:Transcript_32711/g.33055  ORF Transcript_32711/g.33055 Transcript_32711/m.33055 type:complete len:85 (-) Transcript_32711:33-287(-)